MTKILAVFLLCLWMNSEVFSQNIDYGSRFAMSMREFSGNMYEAARNVVGADNNIIFSPLSLYQSLGMLLPGSSYNTKRQLQQTMHLDSDDFSDNRINQLMRETIKRITGHSDDSHDMSNSMFKEEHYALLDNYRKILSDQYKVRFRHVDFGDAVSATGTVNGWIARATRDEVNDVVPSHVIDMYRRLITVNAIYFNSSWRKAFRSSESQVPFTPPDGELIFVDGMYLRDRVFHLPLEQQQVDFYAIPYDSRRSYFIIGIPRVNSDLQNLARQAHAIFGAIRPINTWSRRRITMILPKFELETGLNARTVLERMGLTDIFRPGICRLYGISGENLYIPNLFHKAYVQVNERGTVAAAASSITAPGSSSRRRARVNIDRPFFYGIFNVNANTFSFVGQITRPALQPRK